MKETDREKLKILKRERERQKRERQTSIGDLSF